MKKRITITIDPDIVKRAKIRVIETDEKLSALIEKLLLQWIKDYDKGIDNATRN